VAVRVHGIEAARDAGQVGLQPRGAVGPAQQQPVGERPRLRVEARPGLVVQVRGVVRAQQRFERHQAAAGQQAHVLRPRQADAGAAVGGFPGAVQLGQALGRPGRLGGQRLVQRQVRPLVVERVVAVVASRVEVHRDEAAAGAALEEPVRRARLALVQRDERSERRCVVEREHDHGRARLAGPGRREQPREQPPEPVERSRRLPRLVRGDVGQQVEVVGAGADPALPACRGPRQPAQYPHGSRDEQPTTSVAARHASQSTRMP
jgi:hypothetical protein